MTRESSVPAATSTERAPVCTNRPDGDELDELLTVEDVAALLKVSRSWVYEHTRTRGATRADRLPFIKIGKYTRFDACSLREFLRRRSKFV
jgi:excisionase family DNA binding protein